MAEIRSEILLESGTNELEILEFIIAGNSFGINVAKINKLNQALPVQAMPRSHPFIEGVFHIRDEVYTLVNLPGYLGLPPSDDDMKDIFIVASFNQISIAFRVDRVENIHRISWTAINKPDSTIYGGVEGIVTGITKINERIISIIDFEKIIFDISPETGIQMSEIEEMGERDRLDVPLLVAEDSELLRRMILEALHKAGYYKVTMCDNGQEAWEKLVGFRNSGQPLIDQVSVVITDIEMPQMDGHRLTKLIKDDHVLGQLPVIIFSSLIDEQMHDKGVSVGANAQLSKPEIGRLVSLIDNFAGIVPTAG